MDLYDYASNANQSPTQFCDLLQIRAARVLLGRKDGAGWRLDVNEAIRDGLDVLDANGGQVARAVLAVMARRLEEGR